MKQLELKVKTKRILEYEKKLKQFVKIIPKLFIGCSEDVTEDNLDSVRFEEGALLSVLETTFMEGVKYGKNITVRSKNENK